MAKKQQDTPTFTGFGLGMLSGSQEESDGVFIVAVYRDGQLTASAHATERSAMEAAVDFLADERDDDDDEKGALEDHFSRAQRLIADEGGILEIFPSPIHGG